MNAKYSHTVYVLTFALVSIEFHEFMNSVKIKAVVGRPV